MQLEMERPKCKMRSGVPEGGVLHHTMGVRGAERWAGRTPPNPRRLPPTPSRVDLPPGIGHAGKRRSRPTGEAPTLPVAGTSPVDPSFRRDREQEGGQRASDPPQPVQAATVDESSAGSRINAPSPSPIPAFPLWGRGATFGKLCLTRDPRQLMSPSPLTPTPHSARESG